MIVWLTWLKKTVLTAQGFMCCLTTQQSVGIPNTHYLGQFEQITSLNRWHILKTRGLGTGTPAN